MKKYYIETFGCQMNEFDSERIAYLLDKEGYFVTENIHDCDIVVINTCAVREKAENKLYGHIGNLKNFKTAKPGLIICIGGCTAQNLKEKILNNFPYVDIVFGTHNISKLPELILKKIKSNKNICEIEEKGFDYILDKFKCTYSFKSYIPISIGCNNFCSYCIVPYVRGREISIKPEEIYKTAKRLVSEGIVEIMLLGQNVNSYGKDLDDPITFSQLLDKISQIEGLKRIRFMTSHPKDISAELINIIAEKPNIMNHIHLPLQAGSDKVLKMMNRNYTKEYYLEIVNNIRSVIKNSCITTDIITGFPGEKREDFEHTLDVVKKVRFNRAFTFIYSEREGTSACNLIDNVSKKEKKEWFKELVTLQNQISLEENQKIVGECLEVLVEGKGKKNFLEGRLENNSVVNFEGTSNLMGKFINVQITDAKSFYLTGKIL